MKKVWYVISIGGHLLMRGAKTLQDIRLENYKRYSNVIKKIHDLGYKIVVVTGGGDLARINIARVKEILPSFDEWSREVLDRIGIEWTRLNALMLISTLGSKYTEPRPYYSVHEIDKILKCLDENKIPVCTGDEPFASTDYDSAFIASEIKKRKNVDAIFVNAISVDGIYSTDPKIDPNAKKYDRLSFDEYYNLAKKYSQEPGEYQLDVKAAEMIKKHKIKTIVVNGFADPEEILRAIEGGYRGTIIGE